MRFLRRIAGIFGFVKDDAHDEDEDSEKHHHEDKAETRRPTKGFSVQAQVSVDRSYFGPLLTPCDLNDGGVQGMRWFAKRMRIDEDGDVADEFLHEILPQVPSTAEEHKPLPSPLPKFEVKYNARPAKVRNQFLAIDGRVNQSVEFQGRLLLV